MGADNPDSRDKKPGDEPDETPETPLDEPRPPEVRDPPAEPDTKGPYVVDRDSRGSTAS
jgi:hypothetical protein